VRTVPIPTWVKAAVDAWTAADAITDGPVFRAINKAGRVWGGGMSPKVLWDVVRAAAARAGIDKLAPHDLRLSSVSETRPREQRAATLIAISNDQSPTAVAFVYTEFLVKVRAQPP
jgi:integrase